MKIERLKNNNGFAASDALIAVLIIALFTGIIASLLYNIYLSNASLKRMSKANGYIVDVFEYIDKIYYDDVTIEKLKEQYTYLKDFTGDDNSIQQDENTNRLGILEGIDEDKYTVMIVLDQYKPDENSLDLVKQITMSVTYKLGGKDQTVEMKRIKSREKLISPNKPDLSLVPLEAGENAYPIKEINGNYVVCNQNDSNWYNYQNNKEAKVIVTTSELKVGDALSETDTKIYKWIPRYATNTGEDIKYLYSNTDKYVGEQEGYEKLLNLDEGYTVDTEYFGDTTGIWELI